MNNFLFDPALVAEGSVFTYKLAKRCGYKLKCGECCTVGTIENGPYFDKPQFKKDQADYISLDVIRRRSGRTA